MLHVHKKKKKRRVSIQVIIMLKKFTLIMGNIKECHGKEVDFMECCKKIRVDNKYRIILLSK